MPIYEYVCGDCQRKFERFVRAFGEEVGCPQCGSAQVEKQLSRLGFAGVSSEGRSTQPVAAGGCCGGSCGCAH
jgi:putative FmdB family regulatory protein